MKTHFIGLGGIGMSALAQILLDRGQQVSGSDERESSLLHALKMRGAEVRIGHNASCIQDGMRVVYSSMVTSANPELKRAKELGLPVLHRSDLLNELMEAYQPLIVTGSHGKTTVSSLLAWTLLKAKQDLAYAVGGLLPGVLRHGKDGQDKYFVAEGDESDGSFLKYRPFGAIVTNVADDHLDFYSSLEAIRQAFLAFMDKVQSADHLIYCGDDPWLASQRLAGISYGLSEECMFWAGEVEQVGFLLRFAVFQGEQRRARLEVPLSGEHGVRNALGVAVMAHQLGISWEAIREAFASFPGVARRAERKEEASGVLIIDDYAHHPNEVATTLHGIRSAIGERRLIVVFQPHRYSRLKACLHRFPEALSLADKLIITDVYAASEPAIPGVDGQALALLAQAAFCKRDSIISELRSVLRPLDVVAFLGAGDIGQIADELALSLRLEPLPPLRIALLSGGASKEHEVALSSVSWFEAALARSFFQVSRVGISKEGGWVVGQDAFEKLRTSNESGSVVGLLAAISELHKCEVAVPVFHGEREEGGVIAGLLQLLGCRFVGCDLQAGAATMDKVLTKWVARSVGFATSPFVSFWKEEWQRDPKASYAAIDHVLSLPLFVKPAHLGSTFGVQRVVSREEIQGAVEAVFEWDSRVLIEEEIKGRELEFCVMGALARPRISYPVEILKEGHVHTYTSKYGALACPMDTAPDLPKEVVERGKALAGRLFAALGCRGLSRIDCFLDAKEQWWLNEVNPFPGCTPTSAFPLAWEAAGLTRDAVVDQLIALALRP